MTERLRRTGELIGAAREAELQRRLAAVKERLSAQRAGPYLQGADISAQDMCLAPRLHHILTALPYLKVHVSRGQ